MIEILPWIVTATGPAAIAGWLAGGPLGGAATIGVISAIAWGKYPRGGRQQSWRDDPATMRQLTFAQDLGIIVPPGATKGQVSDMITAVTGR